MEAVEFVKNLKDMCDHMGTTYEPCEGCKLYSGGSSDCGLWELIEQVELENIERAVPVVDEWKYERDCRRVRVDPKRVDPKIEGTIREIDRAFDELEEALRKAWGIEE